MKTLQELKYAVELQAKVNQFNFELEKELSDYCAATFGKDHWSIVENSIQLENNRVSFLVDLTWAFGGYERVDYSVSFDYFQNSAEYIAAEKKDKEEKSHQESLARVQAAANKEWQQYENLKKKFEK